MVKTNQLSDALKSADAIIIGAGAGLSASAGFSYSGKRFHRYFRDYEAKYDFHDMYSGGFYPYPSPEEYWAFWSRFIQVNRYKNPPKPVYDQLFHLVEDKDYFVITTNVDHCFQKSGFAADRLFYTQGDYGLFQCSEPCHKQTYENRQWIERMVKEQKDIRIPTALIPRCPKCGKPLIMNLRQDDRFVENEGWYKAADRYTLFLQRHSHERTLFLELGVGYNTPGIIKYPFWQMTAANPKAVYACINLKDVAAPREIEERSICIQGDIGKVLESL